MASRAATHPFSERRISGDTVVGLPQENEDTIDGSTLILPNTTEEKKTVKNVKSVKPKQRKQEVSKKWYQKVGTNYPQIITGINQYVALFNSIFTGLSESVFSVVALLFLSFVEHHRVATNLAFFEPDVNQRNILAWVIIFALVLFETLTLKTKHDNLKKGIVSRDHWKYIGMLYLFMFLIALINMYGAIFPILQDQEGAITVDAFLAIVTRDAKIVIPVIVNTVLTLSLVLGSQRLTTGIVTNALQAMDDLNAKNEKVAKRNIHKLVDISPLDSRAIYNAIERFTDVLHEGDKVDLEKNQFFNGVTGKATRSYSNITSLKTNLEKALEAR